MLHSTSLKTMRHRCAGMNDAQDILLSQKAKQPNNQAKQARQLVGQRGALMSTALTPKV